MPYSNKWITLELERQLLVDESWAECCPESMRFETEHHTVYSFVQSRSKLLHAKNLNNIIAHSCTTSPETDIVQAVNRKLKTRKQ